MTDYTRNHLTRILGLTSQFDGIRFEVGDIHDTTWFNSWDGVSSQPAVAWVEWNDPEDGATDDAFDAEHLDAHLHHLVESGAFDEDYGIKVTVAPHWLHWHSRAVAA